MNLTPEQALLVADIKQKWLNQMTVPINKEKATAAITDIYLKASLEPPKYFFFCDSPLAAVYLIYQHKINNSIIKGKPLQEKDKKKDLCTIADDAFTFEWGQEWCALFEVGKSKELPVNSQNYTQFYNYCWDVQTVFLYESACYICERPVFVKWDGLEFNHAKYKDGCWISNSNESPDNDELRTLYKISYEPIRDLAEINLNSVLEPIRSTLSILKYSINNQMGEELLQFI